MLRNRLSVRLAGVADFVDSAYLRNQRPKVPGGEWRLEQLRGKSVADLQQIWFTLLRERNMLYSMKDHYVRHTEELGAMPAPSRIKMVEDSMNNLRRVMFDRDSKAASEAEKQFKARIAKGVYRYPPGPQAPPRNLRETLSQVRVTLSGFVEEARLRELLGRYDVFDNHRGIAQMVIELTPESAAAKEKAEQDFDEWRWRASDAAEYERLEKDLSFFDDCVSVELAPGEFLSREDGEQVAARSIPVPAPKEDATAGSTPLERIQHADRTYPERQVIQLGYFPNVTSVRPEPAGERPTHPDEMPSEFFVTILYGVPGGKEYLDSLELTSIDGAKVISIEDTTDEYIAANPPARDSAEYNEAVGQETANTEHLKQWPMIPKWKDEYRTFARATDGEIIQYNYSNVADYVDREALLTNRSIWDCPIPIDPSAGKADKVPPHAEPPTDFIAKEPFAREEY
jgi:large subunit ribosomal protein L47